MDIQIIRATVNDAVDISYVHALSWQAAYAGIVPQKYLDEHTPEKLAEKARKVMPTRPEEYYLAYSDGLPIGMFILGAALDEDVPLGTGEICAMYLLPAYWNKGIGLSLMNYAVNRLNELSYKGIVLWVLRENQRARRFYEKYGFVLDGINKEVFFGKPLIATRYILKYLGGLDEHPVQ